jgi:hypothetical protein
MNCQHSAPQSSVNCLLVPSNDPEARYPMKVGGVVGYESAMVFERRGRENTSPLFCF